MDLKAQFHNVEHHRAHMASAFFVSPFSKAAALSVDASGDFATTMWGTGSGNHIQVLGSIHFPHPLGILYTAVSQWLGFPKYGDEGKVVEGEKEKRRKDRRESALSFGGALDRSASRQTQCFPSSIFHYTRLVV